MLFSSLHFLFNPIIKINKHDRFLDAPSCYYEMHTSDLNQTKSLLWTIFSRSIQKAKAHSSDAALLDISITVVTVSYEVCSQLRVDLTH